MDKYAHVKEELFMKSITVRVEDDFHYEIKMLALKKKKTLQDLILDLLKKELSSEESSVNE